MSISRTLAAAAASTVIAGALVAALAGPATASPIPNPSIPGPSTSHGPITTVAPVGPITPINPNPSMPFPPGGFTISYFSIPACPVMNTARSIAATVAHHPGFGAVATPVGAYGAAAPQLQSVIRTDRGVTCSYGVNGVATVFLTETAITPADYAALKTWYDANATWSHAGGTATLGGGTSATHYAIGTLPGDVGPREYATISSNGWWITVRNADFGVLPYFEMDAVEQFFTDNPRLWLITR